MKIGIMGGTFDPIHYGHLIMAQGVAEKLCLDRVIFIPTGDSPHKDSTDVTGKIHRYNMTKIATSDNPLFEVSDMEIKREEICYTADTAPILRDMYSDAELYYIVGADSLRDMNKWKTPEKFLKILKIAAVDRVVDGSSDAGRYVDALADEYGADITLVKLPVIELSSTEIRGHLKAGKSVRYQTPDSVIEYIKDNNLYGKR